MAPVEPSLIIIAGPTAVGKTTLSIDLAERVGAEIVNADSRSFYRGMDIGTAKPSAADQARVPHHLINFLAPDEPISLARFQDLAYETIDDILARGRWPLLVGGTPQYINAIAEGWNIPRVEPDPAFRARLEDELSRLGVGALSARLRAVDPIAAETCGRNGRRIIRALEVFEKTGVPMSTQQSRGPARYATLEYGLWRPREDLYPRIDSRVHDQVRAGLVDEVRGLLDAGVPPDAPSFSSIGYRQLVPYIRGEEDLDVAISRIQLDTHKLVRHQETWWRKNTRLTRIDMTQPDPLDRVICRIRQVFGDESIP